MDLHSEIRFHLLSNDGRIVRRLATILRASSPVRSLLLLNNHPSIIHMSHQFSNLLPLSADPCILNRNLAPGGWMEVTDICFPARSDDNSWPPNSALKQWSQLMVESAQVLGRFSNSAVSYKSQMTAVGFENVVEVQLKWPHNRWPKDPKLKELGR